MVIDTNTLVSAAIFRRSKPARAVVVAFESGDVLSSSDTQDEMREVFRRSKFDRYVPLRDRMNDIENIIEDMVSVEIVERISVCRDVKDDKVLELAVNGHADCIITGDHDLLTLHPFRGIAILTPVAYLAL